MPELLQINNLSITNGDRIFVKNANLVLKQGDCTALTGPSSVGKSTLFKAVCHLLPCDFSVSGDIYFDSQNISMLNLKQLRSYFGSGFTLILQNPQENFDDRKNILSHFEEAMRATSKESKLKVKELAVNLLYKMQLAYPQNLLKRRAFELSQGMAQRVILALALLQQPKLILADEFTCSLDVITRIQILQLIKNLQREMGFSLFFITHNEDEVKFLNAACYHLENGTLIRKSINEANADVA